MTSSASSKKTVNTKLKDLLIDIPAPSAPLIIEFIEKYKSRIDWKKGDFLNFAIYMNESYSEEVVTYLLKNNFYSPNHISLAGHAPLDFISEQLENENLLKLAQIVISFGGEVNAKDIKGKPIILKAINKNFSGYVFALAQAGAATNSVYEGQALLYYAIQSLPFSYLSAHHINANPLGQSVHSTNNIKIIQTLLNFGANTIDSETDFNALDYIDELHTEMSSFPASAREYFQIAKEIVVAHEEKLKLEASIPSTSSPTASFLGKI